jgi:hypothetical protein
MKCALMVLCVLTIQVTGLTLLRLSSTDPSSNLLGVSAEAVIGTLGATAFWVYRQQLLPALARE